MYKLVLQHIGITTVTVLLVGVIGSRLLPSWSSLVHDVGSSGAWIVAIIFHMLYSLFISGGILLYIASIIKLGSIPSLIINITTSAIVIMAVNIASGIFQIKSDLIIFAMVLILGTWLISIFLYFFTKYLTSTRNAI